MEEIIKALNVLKKEKVRELWIKTTPSIDPKRVLGVYLPDIRRLARQVQNTPKAEVFLHTLPHTFLEENVLHGILVTQIKDFRKCLKGIDAFLPFVDCWGVCDTMISRIALEKVFRGNEKELLKQVEKWLSSKHPYTVRYGIGILMNFFLKGSTLDTHIADKVAGIRFDHYYVNMMRAWFFATALCKHYDTALSYLEQRRLDVWTHNKTIQKAVESRLPTEAQKQYLKTLKIKPVKTVTSA